LQENVVILLLGSSIHQRIIKKNYRYFFFFQLPFLPELYVKSYDYIGFAKMLRQGKGNSSKVTSEDIEAYKYTFSQPGTIPKKYIKNAGNTKLNPQVL
jgi:hypothetical protein